MTSTAAVWDGVRVRVPAKINLGLRVGRLGEDGYHPLETIFQAVSLYDDIAVELLPGTTLTLDMRGEGSELLAADETNLAIRAGRLLQREFGQGRDQMGAAISIRKGIPIAGGMAGGSADAAGCLLALSVLWDLDVTQDDLIDLGAELGSDVPFCILGGTAVGTGRGEQLAPVLTKGTHHWVLALAEEGLSTPAVFRRFDELGLGADDFEQGQRNDMMAALRSGNPSSLAEVLYNDLQEPAFDLRPELADVMAEGMRLGAEGAIVSGSGPTIAFLADNEVAAMDLASGLAALGVCRDVRRATSPVPGARLVG